MNVTVNGKITGSGNIEINNTNVKGALTAKKVLRLHGNNIVSGAVKTNSIENFDFTSLAFTTLTVNDRVNENPEPVSLKVINADGTAKALKSGNVVVKKYGGEYKEGSFVLDPENASSELKLEKKKIVVV